jgi:hypothetical protein
VISYFLNLNYIYILASPKKKFMTAFASWRRNNLIITKPRIRFKNPIRDIVIFCSVVDDVFIPVR